MSLAAASPTEQAESAKRRQIMDGARAIFLAQGFDAASMGEIAREAGVSKGHALRLFRLEGGPVPGHRRGGMPGPGRAGLLPSIPTTMTSKRSPASRQGLRALLVQPNPRLSLAYRDQHRRPHA